MAVKPLISREGGSEIGVRESSGWRVTNNKRLTSSAALSEWGHFFFYAMVSADGSACSGAAIRSLIKKIIDRYRDDVPLSNPEIARQLAQQRLVLGR